MSIGKAGEGETFKSEIETVTTDTKALQQKFKLISASGNIGEISGIAKNILASVDTLSQQSISKTQKEALEASGKMCQDILLNTEMLRFDQSCTELHTKIQTLASSKESFASELTEIAKKLSDLESQTQVLLEFDLIAKNQTLEKEVMRLLDKLDDEIISLSDIVAEKKKEKKPVNEGNKLGLDILFLIGKGRELVKEMKRRSSRHVERRIVQGPRQKSVETEKVQFIVSSLLQDPKSVTFTKNVDPKDGKVTYLVKMKTGETYDLEELLRKVDFSHLQMTREEFDAYEKLCASEFRYRPMTPHKQPATEEFFNKQLDTDESVTDEERSRLKALSLGQKFAINIYTGDAFKVMNSFMRIQINRVFINAWDVGILAATISKDEIDTLLREVLLHTVAAHSALMELPNYVAPADEPTVGQFLFRGEQALPKEILEERVLLAKKHGISREMGFVSLSHTKPDDRFLGKGSIVINREGIVAKKVSELSQWPTEREVVMLPTEIQWEETTVARKGTKETEGKITYLYGRAVRPAVEGRRGSRFEYRLEKEAPEKESEALSPETQSKKAAPVETSTGRPSANLHPVPSGKPSPSSAPAEGPIATPQSSQTDAPKSPPTPITPPESKTTPPQPPLQTERFFKKPLS